jgi:hypothetical protein
MAIFAPIRSGRRDWFRILRDLAAVGVSAAKIARKCNRSPSSVQGWADGGDPKDTDARIVLALYARHCPLKYLEHQAQYEIRTAIDQTVDTGENHDLPFIS